MMFETLFILCALTSIACAALLFRKFREDHSRLVLWTALCFAGLALNNILLLVDIMLLPTTDIDGPFWRNVLSAISGSILLFGLIWEIT